MAQWLCTLDYADLIIALITTVIGGIIVGVVRLCLTNRSHKKNNLQQALKETIYNPLYDELLNNRKILQKYPYPNWIAIDNTTPPPTFNIIKHVIWNEIKSDSAKNFGHEKDTKSIPFYALFCLKP